MFYVWIYFADRIKDFYLPDATSWTGELALSRLDSGFPSDVVIPVRALSGEWHIRAATGYRWSDARARATETKLEAGKILKMVGELATISIVVSKYQKQNTIFKKYVFSSGEQITIGRDANNGIHFADQATTGLHAILARDGSGLAQLTDKGRNGSYLNGFRINGTTVSLSFGDVVTIPTGLKIVYLGSYLAINQPGELKRVALKPFEPEQDPEGSEGAPADSVYINHQRAPRPVVPPDESEIEIEPPLGKQQPNNQPILMSIGPAMTMVLPMLAASFMRVNSGAANTADYLASSLVMVGSSSLLAVGWGVVGNSLRKNQDKQQEVARIRQYRQYIAEMETRLATKLENERGRLQHDALSVETCAKLPDSSSRRLWERMPKHFDFMHVRLGMGTAKLPGDIKTQAKRLQIIEDPLRDEPQRLIDTYGTLSDAPVCVSIRDVSIIGIIGEEGATQLAQSIAMQLAALHSYHDVKLAVLCEESQHSQWAWARWLPHVFPTADRTLRMVVSKPQAIHEVLSHVDEVLMQRLLEEKDNKTEKDAKADQPLPHYVIIATNPELLGRQPIMRRLLSGGHGVSLIMMADSMEKLPKECELLFNTYSGGMGMYSADGVASKLRFEYPTERDCQMFAKRIAPVRVHDMVESAGIPTLVSFLDVCGVRRTEDLDVWRFWNENRPFVGLRSVIGLMGGAQPFVLDISDKYHGPHGLIAGTTGSGKSVMLQTYILSLALNYHPREVQFILIDYKGGGMADAFKDLPHVAGLIDNLQSERIIVRALSSIRGEILRREGIFKRVGVSNIDDYIRLFNDDPQEMPLSHIIIVVDEFAELKQEQPDFMRELVKASRVGRSAGLHLVLATQKPANSVDDEIWSNTRFRICLRVANRGDSMDMLKRPDAANLKGMGRCFVQIGNDEIFEQVQTCYSGAGYDPNHLRDDERPRMLSDAGVPIAFKQGRRDAELTEMDAVLQRIRQVAAEHGVSGAVRLWKEEMGACVSLQQLDGFVVPSGDAQPGWPENPSHEVKPLFALADDVARQRYFPVRIDFTQHRNHMLVGMSASGKTTALQTLAVSICCSYSPEDAQIYIFSLSSRTLGCLEEFPHVGGIVYEDEPNEQLQLIGLLMKENERRQRLFAQASTDNFLAYRRSSAYRSAQQPMPAIIVMVDRMAQARDMLGEDDLARLFALIREGSGRGIFFVVTALTMQEISPKIQGSFRGVSLEQKERGDYTEALGRRLPFEMAEIRSTPGRGILVAEEGFFEMQVALLSGAQQDAERAELARELGARMSEGYRGALPKQLARVPRDAVLDQLLELPECRHALEDPFLLPIAYEALTGAPRIIELHSDFSLLIAGGKASGKTNALRNIAFCFAEKRAEVHLIGCEFKLDRPGVSSHPLEASGLAQLVERMNLLIMQRAGQLKPLDRQGRVELARTFQPVALILDDIDRRKDAYPQELLKLLEQAFAQAEMFGVYIFAAGSLLGLNEARFREPFSQIMSVRRCLLLSTKLSEFELWPQSFELQLRQQPVPLGGGWLLTGDEVTRVIVPREGA